LRIARVWAAIRVGRGVVVLVRRAKAFGAVRGSWGEDVECFSR
jgi:hypothetical protein